MVERIWNQAFGQSRVLAVCALIAVTLLAYAPVRQAQFVAFDDDEYVLKNPHVTSGLTPRNILWAFTTVRGANWIPLVWLSYMLYYSLYGLHAPGYHLTNLFLHLANVLLLFLLLRNMTGQVGRSLFVAFLFAVHPVHVESVAWVAERKDVLSLFFGLLATVSYVRYVRRPHPGVYALAALFFAFSLMAKAMLVTWPLLLLLLDFWPLGRVELPARRRTAMRRVAALVLEKIPFFLLSVAAGLIAYYAESAGGAVWPTHHLPMLFRLCNALRAYADYLRVAVWPTGLAVLYPYPARIPLWQPALGFAVLAGVSALAWRRARSHPWLWVGWFWYVLALAPMIGIIQVGAAARADRFAYLPFIGVYVAVVWSVVPWAQSRPLFQRCSLLPIGGTVVTLWLALLTRRQVGFWKDSETLFSRAVQVTRRNYTMLNNLGVVRLNQGRLDEAASLFMEALRYRPNQALVHCNLGRVLECQGNREAAKACFEAAERAAPGDARVNYHLGNAALRERDFATAIRRYQRALAGEPDRPEAHFNIGVAFSELGANRAALFHYREALRLKPYFPAVWHNLGALYEALGRFDAAANCYRLALAQRPNHPETYCNLARALLAQNRPEEALEACRNALELSPNLACAQSLMDDIRRRLLQADEDGDHRRFVSEPGLADRDAQRQREVCVPIAGETNTGKVPPPAPTPSRVP